MSVYAQKPFLHVTVALSPVVTTLPAVSGNAIVLFVFVLGAVIDIVPVPLEFGVIAILLIYRFLISLYYLVCFSKHLSKLAL